MKTQREQRIRSASPRMPSLVPDVEPVPRPAVISSELPRQFLEGAKGLSVSTKDGQGRIVSTSISAKGMLQRLHKEDKTVISSVFSPPARSSTKPPPLPRFGQRGAESREDLFCLGQRVRARDVVGNRWQMGTVACKDPLLVLPPGVQTMAVRFIYVEAVPSDLDDRDVSEKNEADVQEERGRLMEEAGDLNNNYSYGNLNKKKTSPRTQARPPPSPPHKQRKNKRWRG